MRNISAVVAAIAVCIALAPVAAADEYSDADTEFLAAVTPHIGPGVGPVTKQLMQELIADGHKVCALFDSGQGDVIQPYIDQKYDADGGALGLFIFPYQASLAYCPAYKNMYEERGLYS
jgi:hypothetical protein